MSESAARMRTAFVRRNRVCTPKLTSAEWIDRITREEAIWNELVAAAGDRYDEPGPMGDWTFRNLAHHLNGWRIRTVQRLEAAAEGREPDPAPWPVELVNEADEDATLDAINDWFQERGAERSYEEILAEASGQLASIKAAIAKIPDDRLYDPAFTPWLDGNAIAAVLDGTWDHLMDEHLADVEAWLGRAPG